MESAPEYKKPKQAKSNRAVHYLPSTSFAVMHGGRSMAVIFLNIGNKKRWEPDIDILLTIIMLLTSFFICSDALIAQPLLELVENWLQTYTNCPVCSPMHTFPEM